MPAPNANLSHEWMEEKRVNGWKLLKFSNYISLFDIYSWALSKHILEIKMAIENSKIFSTRALLFNSVDTEQNNFNSHFEFFSIHSDGKIATCLLFTNVSISRWRPDAIILKTIWQVIRTKNARETEQTVSSPFPLRHWEWVLMVRKLCKVNQQQAT